MSSKVTTGGKMTGKGTAAAARKKSMSKIAAAMARLDRQALASSAPF